MKKLLLLLCKIYLLLGLSSCSPGVDLSETAASSKIQATQKSQRTVSETLDITDLQDTATFSPKETAFTSFECTKASSAPLIKNGESILFLDRSEGNGQIVAVDGFSGRIYEIQKFKNIISRIIVSKDGTELAFELITSGIREAVVYNLISGQLVAFPLNIEEGGGSEIYWTEDGRIGIEIDRTENIGSGISFQTILLDPKTGRTEVSKGQYSLPGYFRVSPGFLTGIPAIDPMEERALYEKWDGEENITTKTIFLNLTSQQVIWKHDTTYSGEPDWATDGSEVVFGSLYGSEPYLKILSLTREGKISELSHQPLADYEYMFRYFRISPDHRYIHFSLWQSIGSGPGYVLDTKDKEIREICGYLGEFIEGEWLVKKNLLVYKTQVEGETHFWILDAQNWKTRKLISGKNITYIGFSSAELSR